MFSRERNGISWTAQQTVETLFYILHKRGKSDRKIKISKIVFTTPSQKI
jgi:hypothetical protein